MHQWMTFLEFPSTKLNVSWSVSSQHNCPMKLHVFLVVFIWICIQPKIEEICGSKAVRVRRSIFDLIPMESGRDFGKDSYEKMPSMKPRKRQRRRRTRKILRALIKQLMKRTNGKQKFIVLVQWFWIKKNYIFRE